MIDFMSICVGKFISPILSLLIGASMFIVFPCMMFSFVVTVILLVGDNCLVTMTIGEG